MSNPGDTPNSSHTPDERFTLEDWALELERGEHGGRVDPEVQQQLERVAAVLRALPEPEPAAGLGEKIRARVAEDAARPRVLRGRFGTGRGARRVALALAAGVAGLAVWSTVPQLREPSFELAGLAPASQSAPAAAPIRIEIPRGAGDVSERVARASLQRIAPQPRSSGPQLVSLGAAQRAFAPTGDPHRARIAWVQQLDHELNQLQLDPHAYASALERRPSAPEFIALLARRAGERGDAPAIAMRVRDSRHPLAQHMVNRLMRAALVEHVSPR